MSVISLWIYYLGEAIYIKKSGIKQNHWLDLVNIHLLGKNYQNIPSGLQVIRPYQLVKILPWWGYLQRNQALDTLIG